LETAHNEKLHGKSEVGISYRETISENNSGESYKRRLKPYFKYNDIKRLSKTVNTYVETPTYSSTVNRALRSRLSCYSPLLYFFRFTKVGQTSSEPVKARLAHFGALLYYYQRQLKLGGTLVVNIFDFRLQQYFVCDTASQSTNDYIF